MPHDRRSMTVNLEIDHGEMDIEACFDYDGVLEHIEVNIDNKLFTFERCELSSNTIKRIHKLRDSQDTDFLNSVNDLM